jgi:hypothetical protein
MEAATEELIKAFVEDEERSRRIREKAAMGAVLVNGTASPSRRTVLQFLALRGRSPSR